jgi:RHS repeat-associated protein
LGCLKPVYHPEEPSLSLIRDTMETAQNFTKACLFAFNGMEKDNDVYGDGNSYTTDYRQYDPRLGRWLSIDPLFRNFPWQSPYAAFDNNPILIKDPRGLAGESSNGSPGEASGNPDRQMQRQNKRYERLIERLADKYGAGTDQFNSELARLGSKARYGSKLSFGEGHESPATARGNTGSINRKFEITFDNTKATYQQQPIFGQASRGETPTYPTPGDEAGEVTFDVQLTDGQPIYMQAQTLSGYQVQVFVNGTLLTSFAPAPQPIFDPANPQGARHTRTTEYKSAAVTTGSPTPQLVKITFKTVFTDVGAKVHYVSYPLPTNTSNVSVGTLRR